MPPFSFRRATPWLALLLGGLAGCKSSSSGTTTPVASVSVTPSSVALAPGGSSQLTAVPRDADGNALTDRTVTWSSASLAVATVSTTGLVAAVSVGGPVTITATSEGRSGTAAITVAPVPVGSVSVSPLNSTVVAGTSAPLTATTKDAAGNVLTGRTVTWTSSNSAVATVNATTGLVTGVAAGGPVTITAASEGQNGTATIIVTAVAVASVAVTPPTNSIVTGSTTPLTATLKDAAGNPLIGRTVVWTSSNAAVASVNSSTGVVTGVAAGGPVTITATSEGQTGTAAVTVTLAPVASVTVAGAASVGVGRTATFTATLKDAGGNVLTGRTVTWMSSNSTLASVNPATGVVTGVALGGPVTITATSGGQNGSAPVTVVFALTSISSGQDHNCGLTADGTAYCWGANSVGQVGDGTTTNRNIGTPVAGGLHFAFVTAGLIESCGGILGSGTVDCWGGNGSGQAGDGTMTQHTVPTPAVGGLALTSITIQDALACGNTAAGVVYCWGTSAGVVLASAPSGSLVPLMVTSPAPLFLHPGGAGSSNVCGTSATSIAYCWGANQGGGVGNGTLTFNQFTPMPVSTPLTFTRTFASIFFSCGVTTGNGAYCWGRNSGGSAGAFGNGTATDILTPTPVSGGLTFTDIVATAYSSCGLATDGTVYCWGQNPFGVLGDGTTTAHNVPMAVSGNLKFSAISAGTSHVCALTVAGLPYCWGDNSNGALGTGSVAAELHVPTAVVF
jgi:uncharacterized protein YjdB